MVEKDVRYSKIGMSNVFVLKTPLLIKEAKQHFGCESLTGVVLENEGDSSSAGSHFEKLHYGNELMTPTKSGRPIISKLILALLQDTTWY